jgi:hypothetical protein
MGSVKKKSIQSTIMTLKNIANGFDTKMGFHFWSVPYQNCGGLATDFNGVIKTHVLISLLEK